MRSRLANLVYVVLLAFKRKFGVVPVFGIAIPVGSVYIFGVSTDAALNFCNAFKLV